MKQPTKAELWERVYIAEAHAARCIYEYRRWKYGAWLWIAIGTTCGVVFGLSLTGKPS